MKDGHNHTPDEEHRIREAALDETIAELFPVSAPASSLPNPDEHDAEGSGAEPVHVSKRPPALENRYPALVEGSTGQAGPVPGLFCPVRRSCLLTAPAVPQTWPFRLVRTLAKQ